MDDGRGLIICQSDLVAFVGQLSGSCTVNVSLCILSSLRTTVLYSLLLIGFEYQ